MSDYGIKITRDGYNITSTEPRDYVFNSSYTTVKIALESGIYGTISVPANGSATATITHNLGFVPLVMLFTELNPGSGRWYNGVAVSGPDDNASGIGINNVVDGTYVDSTKLYIVYTNSTGSSKTVKYYYFIFGDSGS